MVKWSMVARNSVKGETLDTTLSIWKDLEKEIHMTSCFHRALCTIS